MCQGGEYLISGQKINFMSINSLCIIYAECHFDTGYLTERFCDDELLKPFTHYYLSNHI